MVKEFYLLVHPISLCKYMRIKTIVLLCAVFICFEFAAAQSRVEKLKPFVKDAVFAISSVMMHDVVSPVIASRYYMYCTIGAHAIIATNHDAIPHPSMYIKHFPKNIGLHNSADPTLAALFCIYETGMAMLPSGLDMVSKYKELQKKVRSLNYSSAEINSAVTAAKQVSKEILQYAGEDGYFKLSTFPKYRPKRKDGFWFPTPPAYMDAVDPHWRTMRPLMIDSAKQFPAAPPVPYDTNKESKFYSLTTEVYQIGKTPSIEQKEIAAFWDCNPFVVATSGHMNLGFKKISPGGHWMNIVCISALSQRVSFHKMIQVLSIEAMGLYDAFIVCWNEKYTSDRARPETIINKYIDIKWQPLLQTPPFPEYTSGHSVVSSVSAELLSFLIGDEVSFTDDSEIIFELPPRKFSSFRQAANEASISRLYGGIHFRDAIENGQDQGKRIGMFLIEKLKQAGIK